LDRNKRKGTGGASPRRTGWERQSAPRNDMKLWKRLQNPFFLIGQGFVLGGILVFATQPESRVASASPAPLAEPIAAAATPSR